nr:amino acid adenylation domain-containing protein [Nitrosopumilus sp.]
MQNDVRRNSNKEYPELELKNPTIVTIPFIHFEQQSIERTIISRFEEQVLKFPDKIAICETNSRVNYSELNNFSNGLAVKILELYEKSDGNIALLLENGTPAIIGMLGVLKTGNAYIPLDLNYPTERLKYIIKDTNCKLIIASSSSYQLAIQLKDSIKDGFIISIDQDIIPVTNNVKPMGAPNSIAYILYTSGSTGEPKGVIQSQRNVLHFIRIYTNNLQINKNDRISWLSTYSFDSSVMDIYGALLNGACLYTYNLMQEGISLMGDWLNNNQISILHTVPTLYRYIISSLKSEVFKHIRLVVLGGEAAYKKDFEDFKNHFTKKAIFINGYGPTESTITLQKFLNYESIVDKKIIPIGFVVEHTNVYILKENDQEADLGEIGEIVYKSEYLALGYWNKQEQTEKVFTIDPITKAGRVYRSGDLGTRLPDGEIEFAGRKDDQVKIRGQRVELSEIEQNIINVPGIDGVAVAIKNVDDQDRIVAYILSKQKIYVSNIREALKQSLPSYMLPDFYEFLEKFPLTRTGKINRKALPDPDIARGANPDYIAPRTALEMS